jgi:Transposase IS116/IS110/IS902 family
VRQIADQIALLMDQEHELRANIDAVVRTNFAPLLAIEGVRVIVAAGLIAELGMPWPGFGVPEVAALAGVAPIEASSAGDVRHRLSRRGNRRLKRVAALRGWDTSGRPPHCPICHRQVDVIFVDTQRGWRSCRTCWLESSGTSPKSTSWHEHVIVRYDEPGGDGTRR